LRPQDLARLVALAAVWGASYLFMRHAVQELGPVRLIELRVAIGGILLSLFLAFSRGSIDWRRHWKDFLFVGAIGIAFPFVLIAGALTSIDASTAAILNALSPLFTALIAAAWIRDPLTMPKLAGIALCLVGTMVLVGWTPTPMTHAQLLGAAMSVGATALYGLSNVYTKVRLKNASAMGTSVGTLLMAATALAPIALVVPAPRAFADVSSSVWIATGCLAFFSTAIAFIWYYHLIADVGPVKSITVTLLVPVFGMVWGILLLGEPVTPGRIAGCAIILAGCSLILGIIKTGAGPHSRR
jgi:drug/metabolite transporter (DMT)-like permease